MKMDYIPPEIIRHILEYLPLPSTRSVARVFNDVEKEIKDYRIKEV